MKDFKMSIEMIEIKKVAEIFGISADSLYKACKRCQRKNEPVMEIQGKHYFVFKGTARMFLIPTELPSSASIERMENAAAGKAIGRLIPFLCPDCKKSCSNIKDYYEKN